MRSDYRELVELCIVLIGRNSDSTIKIRPPGTLHHARWMAIYSFKIFLFRQQLSLQMSEVNGLKNICLFLVTVYVKSWLESSSAIGAPFNDLMFFKKLKKYENINRGISSISLKKFCNHLWYLNEESSILTIFDKNVNIASKKRIIENLKRGNLHTERKCIVQPNEVPLLLEKAIDFISQKSLNLLKKLNIDISFLNISPNLWDRDDSYLKSQEIFQNLRVVNDTAERGVKLIQDFNGLLTVDEEQRQFLLQCVEDHRKQHPACKKVTLKRKCD
ncbi:hypothetical protein AVEN_196653-1 [Araneus ventricosus]|uniref:Uncharacterized protein n=1 Tax=Araneus ventricosus TaxID=182803 RepID=A0A4Y2E363_ARAVE|nr:hypothetical protein AVEN_196653-1 [Araneus ventricosus]